MRCSVVGCTSNSESRIPGLSFHSFPNNSDAQKKWIAACGRNNWVPRKYSKICCKHFDPNVIRKTGKYTFLRPNAAPILAIRSSGQSAHTSSSTRRKARPRPQSRLSTSPAGEDTNYYTNEEYLDEDTDSCGDNVSDSAPKRPTCCCCLKACAGLPLWRAGGEGAALEVFIGLQYPPEVRPSLHICAECSAQLAAAAEFRRRAMAAYPILLHQKVIPETVIHEFDIEDDFEEDKPDVNELDSLMESETQNQSQEEEDIKPDVSQLGSLISASPAIEPEPEDIKPDISQLTVSPAHVSTLDHSYSDTPPTTTPQYMNTKTDVKSEHSCDAPLRTSQYIVIDSGVVHVLSSRASAAKNDELAPSAAEEAVEHASPPLSPSSSFDASSSVRPETDSGSPPTKVKKITQLIKENK